MTENFNYVLILREIVKLRNAIAHDESILNNLLKNEKSYHINGYLINFLDKCEVSKSLRNKHLKNYRVKQIVCVLFIFNEIVINNELKIIIRHELNDLFYFDIVKNKNYYINNNSIISIYKFFKKIVAVLLT